MARHPLRGSHMGSIRNLLCKAAYVRQPDDLRPFNRKWKFDRRQHEDSTRRYAEDLVQRGQAILNWLDNGR
jgi:hypothetical protein